MIGLALFALALAVLALVAQTIAEDGGPQGRHALGVAHGTDAQRVGVPARGATA